MRALSIGLLIPLLVISVTLAIYWLIVLARLLEMKLRLPKGSDGVAMAEARAEPDTPVLVVVPAHNEAGTIGPLIRSLREQDHERFHVVLALDRCTDGTAAVARREIDGDHRFEVIEIEDCPAGWAGKVNAVRTAVERAAFEPEAELVLFTDADCVLHPSCLRAAVALLEARSLDLLSFVSEVPAERWFELVVQPIAGFELLRQYPLIRANRFDDRQRPFANGQFLLFKAATYREIGGHAAVRDELLEDLALARLVKRNGGRAGALLGDGVVWCRMYEDWEEFKRGWRRIYTEAAQRRSARLRTSAWRMRLLNAVFPPVTLLLGVAASWACLASGAGATCVLPIGLTVAGLGSFAVAMVGVQGVARVPLLALPTAPIGAWLVSSLLFEAADDLSRGEPTVWGGRAYLREDRSTVKPREVGAR